MLIEFSIGNYKSFKDIVTFSMVAANLTSKNKKLDVTNTFNYKKSMNLLKAAAIYGSNASGKSNFIKAQKELEDIINFKDVTDAEEID